MVVAVVMQHGSANCIAFGQYILLARGNSTPASWQTKGIGIAALTFSCILHAIFPKSSMRLMNLLGVFKLMLILLIIFAGFAALAGHLKIPKPDNFAQLFENSSADAYDYIIALNFVNFSYSGWQTANYVCLLVFNINRLGFIRAEETRKDNGYCKPYCRRYCNYFIYACQCGVLCCCSER